MITTDNIKQRYGCEMALLILCCRVFFNTATIAELKLFVEEDEVNWDNFLRFAKAHRVRPVVYNIIANVDLPADVKKHILITQVTNVKLNWEQAFETERIITLLKQHNIQVLPYKGVAFSMQFFGDLISRESSDIDLVIKPEDLDAAIKILKQDSYLPETDDIYHYLGKRYTLYYKDYNLNKFKNNSRQFHIELHWAVSEYYIGLSQSVNQCFYQADGEVKLTKSNVKCINKSAHYLAVLIHHSIKDNYKSLKNIVDLAQIINRAKLQGDYGVLSPDFDSLNLKKVSGLSNVLVENLIGLSLPGRKPQLHVTDKLVNHFMDQLFLSKLMRSEDKSTLLTYMKNRILLQDSVWLKWRFYIISLRQRFVPNEIDIRFFKLPKKLFFMYYILKPFRSFVKPMDISERKRKLFPVQ